MLLYQEDISNILASSTSWREREYVQFVFLRILFAMKIDHLPTNFPCRCENYCTWKYHVFL